MNGAVVMETLMCCRTRLGPNEVDVKDLESYPNASKKDAAAPPIQEVAKPDLKQVTPAVAAMPWPKRCSGCPDSAYMWLAAGHTA